MLRTRDDIFKAINIEIANDKIDSRALKRSFHRPGLTLDNAVNMAAYYVMVAEQVIRDDIHDEPTCNT